MSVEFRDPPREGTSFLRPIERHPAGPRERTPSTHTHRSRGSNSSWGPVIQRTRPPPPEPIPVPSPVQRPRGLSESGEEHMIVDTESFDDLEAGGGNQAATSRRKRFVGGLVSGLRKLPKVMMKRYTSERDPVRRWSDSTSGTIPQYAVRPPETAPVAGPSNVQFVEQPMVIPAEDTYSLSEDSTIHQRLASGSTEQSGFDHDGATTLVNHDEVVPPPPILPIITSPDFSQTSDYNSNMVYNPPVRSDASLGTHLARINTFFTNLKQMPWIAQSRVTFDYIPGEANRKRFYPSNQESSWYPPMRPQSPLDLLAEASPPDHASSIPAHKRSSVPESPVQSLSGHDHGLRRSSVSPTGVGQPVYPHGYIPYASYQSHPLNVPPPSAPMGWGQPAGFGSNYASGQQPMQVMPGYVMVSEPPHIHNPILRPPPAQTAP